MKKTFFILSLLFLTHLNGCGPLLNSMFDERKVFSSERDSEVGDSIDWLLHHNARYHWVGPASEQRYNSSYTIIERTPNINEHQFKIPECSWALDVDKKTGKVISWKYLGDPSGCKSKKFYEGPW